MAKRKKEQRRRRIEPPRAARPHWPSTALLIGVIACVAVAYWPSFAVGYLFDDHDAIERNPYLAHAGTWEWAFRVPENSTLIGRVVLSWSFGLNSLIFGHDPAVYHVFNLLIHLVNVVLVAVLMRRGLEHAGVDEPVLGIASLMTALLWGLHPLDIDAVAYLTQRGESLAVLWILGSLYAWMRAQEPKADSSWYAIACAGPVFCVATKEYGWITALVPLLWAWVFKGRRPPDEIRRNRAFYASAVASWVLLAGLTFSSGRLAHVGAEPGIDSWSYFVSQPGVLTHYMKLFFVPIGQSFDYDWPVSSLRDAAPYLVLWSAAFIATAFAVWRRSPAGFPAALAFLSLATSSSFLPLPDLAFEHRFYLAGACTTALCVGALAWVLKNAPGGALRVACAAVGCVAVALGVLTWQRCTLFQDELSVWREAIERNPTQRRALSNVGGILLARGKTVEALGFLRRVEQAGIPHRMQTRINLHIGNALFDLERYGEARTYYQKSLAALNGDPGPLHHNIGNTYLQEDDFADARKEFERALETMDRLPALYFDLAYACSQMSDTDCMIRAYERGRELGGRPQPILRDRVAIFRPDLR